jgi:DNA mismatch endonuclease (patch repair protein)
MVFKAARVAVFVDGCFWHGCPEHFKPPRTNEGYWGPKIDGNRARDVRTDTALRDAGWEPVRVWEHEDPLDAADRVAAIVEGRRWLLKTAGGADE